MIRERWYAILESHEVPRRRAVGVTRLGERLALWRDDAGRVWCVAEQCPHRGAALGAGRVVEGCVECPFHGFRFDATGRCTLIPSNGRGAPVSQAFRVRVHPVREEHGFVWLWWGEERAELPPVPFFEDIGPRFSWATLRDPWPVHYTRAIENQLDVAHVPFVHATTIGRGLPPVVDGPPVRLEGDKLEIWPTYRADDGTPAKKPAEVPIPERPPMLEFRFPNIWQNRLGPKLRIVAAFAPVDDANTVVYVRFCQAWVGVPGLRWLVNRVGHLGDLRILAQDRDVVLPQRPIRSEHRMGEKLVAADQAIILFRRRRAELLAGAKMADASADVR